MRFKEHIGIPGGRANSQWLILLLFLALQAPFLFRPIEGHHMSRQADTAGVARNLAFESFDMLRPRIDLRGDKSGIVGMEFPIYQAVVAAGMRVIGDYDAVGKTVSLLAAVAAWIVLVKLLVRSAGVDPWAAQAAMGACPVLFIYSARIMPETSALLFMVVALERFYVHSREKSQPALYTGAAALALASLMRPYVIFAGLPLLFLWLGELRNRRAGLRYLAAGALVAAPFLLWYYVWWPHLERVYGLDYFFRGSPFWTTLAEMGQTAFWVPLVNTIVKFYLNWLCFPFAVWGAVRVWRAKQRTPGVRLMAFWLPMVAVAILCLVIGDQFVVHEYYLLSLAPWSALLVASGLTGLRQRHPGLGVAMCILVTALTPALFWKYYRRDVLLPAYEPVEREIAARTHKSDLVLIEEIETSRGAWYLHPIRRRGWIEPRAQLDDSGNIVKLYQQGLRWIVWYDGRLYHLSDVRSWMQRLGIQS